MEENLPADLSGSASPRNCNNCGQPAMEGDHAAPLCATCRDKFVRTPVPVWIWLFAGAVVLVMLYSLRSLPANMSLGMQLEKGKKAVKQKRFLTAERELKQFTKKIPGNIEAEGNLMIAAFYNEDFTTFKEQFLKLENKKMDDDDLFARLDVIMQRAALYYPTDPFNTFTARYPEESAVPDSAWKNYFDVNTADVAAKMIYANTLFEDERYAICDSVCESILMSHNHFFPALMLGASAKRELGRYDDALAYNKMMLEDNRESIRGLASETRTLLRLKQDADALDVAQQATRLDDRDPYVRASLILAYHFNGKIADRDALIQKAMKEATDSADRKTVQYALDVIAKKEKFRD